MFQKDTEQPLSLGCCSPSYAYLFSSCDSSKSTEWRVLQWKTREVARSFSCYSSWRGELGQAESTVAGTSAREGAPFLQPGTAAAQGLQLWLLHAPRCRGWHRVLLSALPPCRPLTLEGRVGKAPVGKELHCGVGSNVLDAI